jgi:FAD/FMN-containing dehydrogenase
MQECLAALRNGLGAAGVATDPQAMEPYLTDWRRAFHGQAMAVLLPGSTEEVAEAIQICARHGVGVVPQGGNTGLAGGATPAGPAPQVVLSLARMQRLRKIDPIGMTMEVEAGMPLATARRIAAEAGRAFPVSIASEGTATVGGIIATNAGGVNVLRYGMARDLVLGLDVVLADGARLNGLRHLRKNNAGVDWKQLFIGSEGALGVVTAAVLRLVPALHHRRVALLALADLRAVLDLFGQVTESCGEALTAFELISPQAMELVARHMGRAAPVEATGWTVLVEFGSSLPGLDTALEGLMESAFARSFVQDGTLASSERQAADLWALRENITMAEAVAGPSLKHDISVPISSLPQFVARFEVALREIDPAARPNLFGHVGDGNLHANVIGFHPDKAGQIARAIHDLAWGLGGSITAEHGLGQYRLSEFERLAPPEEQAMLRRLKAALDPEGCLNPGKSFPGSASEVLR